MTGKITTRREYETLRSLMSVSDYFRQNNIKKGFVRPMDVGGSKGSHHGSTLSRLAKKGLCDVSFYKPGTRRVNSYKINNVGRFALQTWEKENS
jgi:hypothetical protein